MADIQKERSLEDDLFTVFKIAVIVTVAILFTYFMVFRGGLSADHERWSEFGAFIGGTVGALISFFAFFALLLTIGLQAKAIKVSREELELTRKELERTSEAAIIQAEHFRTEARINDIVASIENVEHAIQLKAKRTLPVFDHRVTSAVGAPLDAFLKKDMELISNWSTTHKDLVNEANLRPEEIGGLFKLLYDQLSLLAGIDDAKNRYRVLMHKHLETFFLLSQVSALPFDWEARLDEESQSWLKIYEENYKAYEIQNAKKYGPKR